ncbi:MAG: polysaccharide biosynthesis/export family protein, partial [Epsilonproteobacteria bacterium]|nr:polysaccharide biosynthesis/export family protein [Campylobacterota bacterium]
MKKHLNWVLFLVGVISITSLFGASSLENTILIEQLKKDKSLQDKIKEEQKKEITAKTTTKIPVVDLKPVVQEKIDEPLAKNEDIEKKEPTNLPSKTLNKDNYYKNLTPFFYEDQVSLVDEIEKRQVIVQKDVVLKRFGVNFFKNGSSEIPTSGVPDDYILSTGDSLKISVYGLSEYDGELEINKDGKIIIPQVGAI